MSSFCCAVGALLQLTTLPDVRVSIDDVWERCSHGCRGVGLVLHDFGNGTVAQQAMGCSGLLTLPSDRNGGSDCGPVREGQFLNETRMMTNFRANRDYSGTDAKGVCRGPSCVATFGSPIKVRSKHSRPVRVAALSAPGERYAKYGTIVEFSQNHIPPRSKVTGPLTLRCSQHSARMTVGAGSTITNVYVDCPGNCPLHVKLDQKSRKLHTKISDVNLNRHVVRGDVLAEAKKCSVMITPVPPKTNPRVFVGEGDVTVQTSYGHGIAVANVRGKLHVANTGRHAVNVTVLDTIEDRSRKRKESPLRLTYDGQVHLRNITTVLDVFSQEYMIEFFGPSPRREYETKGLARLNWAMASIILALVAGDPDTIPRALPTAQQNLPV